MSVGGDIGGAGRGTGRDVLCGAGAGSYILGDEGLCGAGCVRRRRGISAGAGNWFGLYGRAGRLFSGKRNAGPVDQESASVSGWGAAGGSAVCHGG